MRRTTRVPDRRGFSLIEAVMALGLLAGVLISVASLLVIAGRRVNSGRSSSEALVVARDVLEQQERWSFHQLYGLFTCDPSADTCLVDSRTDARAAGWQAALTSTVGPAAHAEILLEGLDGTGAAVALEGSAAIRVTVSVRWIEGIRDRVLRLVTVRT